MAEAIRQTLDPRSGLPAANRIGSQNGTALYVLILLTLANVLNYMDRMALSVLLPAVKTDLRLSDGQLGLLVGFSFSICYALCGIPVARLADSSVRKNVVAASLVVWSAATALCGAASGFWHLFAARILVGVGEAGCIAPSQSIICDTVPPRRRSSALSFHIAGTFVGIAVSMAAASYLEARIGWRWTFVALSLPGIGLALMIWGTMREPARGRGSDAVEAAHQMVGWREALRMLASSRLYCLLVAMFILNGFLHNGVNQWMASFYARVHGLNPSDFGPALGVAMGGGSGLGLVFGGLVADRLAARGLAVPLRVGALSVALAIPPALLSLFTGNVWLSIALIGVANLLWSTANGHLFTVIFAVTQPSIRATASAVALATGSIVGMGFGPYSVGLLSDYLAPRIGEQALRYALLSPVSALPFMVVVLWMASRLTQRSLATTDAFDDPVPGNARKATS